MATTTRFALPTPDGADVPDVPTDMAELAGAVDVLLLAWLTSIASSRPGAGTAGRLHRATDTSAVALDDGSSWRQFVMNGDTLTSFLDYARNQLRKAILVDYTEKVETVAASGSSRTLALATANVWDVTLSSNCTFDFSGMRNGEMSTLTLILRNDATGRTPTFTGVLWPNGTAPELTAASSVHLLSFFSVNGGATKFGVPGGLSFG